MHLQRVARGGGRALPPQVVHEPVHRQHVPGTKREQGEQGPLFARAEVDRCAGDDDRQRSQHPHVDRCHACGVNSRAPVPSRARARLSGA